MKILFLDTCCTNMRWKFELNSLNGFWVMRRNKQTNKPTDPQTKHELDMLHQGIKNFVWMHNKYIYFI